MMQQTNLKNDNVLAAEWDKATNLQVYEYLISIASYNAQTINKYCLLVSCLFRNYLMMLFWHQELDITATDLSKECLMEVLTKIQNIRWLSAGQLDGMTDAVLKVYHSAKIYIKTCHFVKISRIKETFLKIFLSFYSTGWRLETLKI